MDLEFKNLSYTITKRGLKGQSKKHEILNSLNGKFYSGQLAAIMGPSGAGKSSLLNALSGYRICGVTGDIVAGGYIPTSREFHKRSCYITQDDLLQPLLTVGELMAFSASLKLSPGSERRKICLDILTNMGLAEQKNTRTEFLSGGQKKRLSIALELVNNPPVFFLDEPTSGLDQVTSTNCIKLLQSLAREGRTVICTIHQPSASVFQQFDQVYVIAKGSCVYQGSTKALVPFLSTVGLPCPRHHNPADFIIEATENPINIKILSDIIKNRLVYKNKESHLSTDLHDNSIIEKRYGEIASVSQVDTDFVKKDLNTSTQAPNSTMSWLKIRKTSFNSDTSFATSSLTQFRIILVRMLLQIKRNSVGIWIQTIHHILCGVLIGLCFQGTANDGILMFGHLKFCIGVTIFFAYTQIMIPVLIYPQEVKLVKKEYFNRWYGLTPYFAALTISKLPLQITLNTIFCTIVYFMWGLPMEPLRFTMFCLIGNMVSLVAEGVGLSIGSMFSITNGCAIGPMAIAPFLGLAIYGFDFAKQIPMLMYALMRTSFVRCGVVALILTVFGYDRKPLECSEIYCHYAKPEVLLNFLDIGKSSVWFEMLSLLVLLIIFRLMIYMNLRRRFSK